MCVFVCLSFKKDTVPKISNQKNALKKTHLAALNACTCIHLRTLIHVYLKKKLEVMS